MKEVREESESNSKKTTKKRKMMLLLGLIVINCGLIVGSTFAILEANSKSTISQE